MNTHLKHAVVLPILILAMHLANAPLSAQIRVQAAGRAFDAPGAANSANNPTDAFLTSPYSPSVAGSLSTGFRLNQFDINTNLPTLSAAIDPNNALVIRSTTFNPGTNSNFNLQGISLPAPVLQPYGLTALSLPAALPQPSFAVPTLSTAIPSLSVSNLIPAAIRSGIAPGTFDLSNVSAPLALPQFSDPASAFSNSLQTTVDGAIANLDQLLYNTAYDEVELRGGPPPATAMSINPYAPRSAMIPFIPSPAARPGLIDTNFGFTPASGTATATLPTALTPYESDSINSDFQLPTRRIPEPPSPTAPVPPLARQANDALERDIFNTSLLGDSLIHQTLQDAWRTTSATTPASAAGDFTFPKSSAPGAARDPFPPSQAVYAEMKQTVQWIKHLRDERNRVANEGARPPFLSDAYDRALSFVRGTEQEPLSSFVGDGIDPSEQFARKAERYLKTGNYYRALTSYEVALVSDRNNPLLLLGQGHALIGTGEHYGAVRKIVKAIENFPEIAYFKLDLNKFITDADLLDIRRADLETRLAERDDHRLRFLLGYIEYYIGLPEFGVENLKAAATAAPQNSPIARFPQMLELGDTLRMR